MKIYNSITYYIYIFFFLLITNYNYINYRNLILWERYFTYKSLLLIYIIVSFALINFCTRKVVLCVESRYREYIAGRWPLFLDSSRRWSNRYNVPRVGRNLLRRRRVRLANHDRQGVNTSTSENYRSVGRYWDSLLIYSPDAISVEHLGHLLPRIFNCNGE